MEHLKIEIERLNAMKEDFSKRRKDLSMAKEIYNQAASSAMKLHELIVASEIAIENYKAAQKKRLH